jgi:UDP-3-O-[3-hydroxymyristoyl] glucosamine N-acyltransferase
VKLSRIAAVLECGVDPVWEDMEISRISSLSDADENSISFLSNPKMEKTVSDSRVKAIIVKKNCLVAGKINLEVDDPYLGYARVATLFEDNTPLFEPAIHSLAIIDPDAHLDSTCRIGPGTVIGAGVCIGPGSITGANCVIEKNSVIGSNCRIDSGVIIRYETHMGDRVIIQSGSVIGSDGFANAMDSGKWVRIPCFGNVVIEDDVQIGACVTIDRGNFEPTIIRTGARLDNLIHIAHNVTVGRHTAIAAQTGVSGSTRIGDGVLIGGQAGFVGHIEIGDRSFIGAKAGVSKNVQPGSKVTGYPARDFMKMRRIEACQQELPEMLRLIKNMNKRIEQLEAGSQQ